MASETPAVLPDQVWTDPRTPTRRLLVTEVGKRWVTCRSSYTDRPGSRATRIELWTFRRYQLLEGEGA
jgi:hypothetical protein